MLLFWLAIQPHPACAVEVIAAVAGARTVAATSDFLNMCHPFKMYKFGNIALRVLRPFIKMLHQYRVLYIELR